MKKYILKSIIKIVFAVFVLFLSNNLFGQKRDYNKAIKAHTVIGYKTFLQEHPESYYFKEIQERLITLEFENLKSLNQRSSQKSKTANSQQIESINYEIEKHTEFIETYPNSQFQEIVSTKLKELEAEKKNLEEAKKQEALKKQEEINKMINLIEGYKIDSTTETTFRADGWNFNDPYYGKTGINGFKREGNRMTYYLGISTLDKDKYDNTMGKGASLELIERDVQIKKQMYEQKGSAYPSNLTVNAYCLIFENGLLISREKFIKKQSENSKLSESKIEVSNLNQEQKEQIEQDLSSKGVKLAPNTKIEKGFTITESVGNNKSTTTMFRTGKSNEFLIEKTDSEKEVGEIFLDENKKREGVHTTNSGLQYEVIRMGTGEKPGPTSKVKVHYHGTLINGTVFDSSVERGEPIIFPLNYLIKGWTEALQLMPVGSKWKIYIPYNLAYGEKGVSTKIKPYSTLIFEIELFEIISK